jgi:hypothetical protein
MIVLRTFSGALAAGTRTSRRAAEGARDAVTVTREDRLAQNERLIREIDEEADMIAREGGGPADTEVEFACACCRPACDGRSC